MRGVTLVLLLIALSGCQYGPLEHAENAPQIQDAFIERDYTVSGTSIVSWREQTANGGVGGFICEVEQEVEGWGAAELNNAVCVGCERVHTLAMRTTNGDECEFGGPGAVDIAFADLDFLAQTGTSESFIDWLDEEGAIGYLNATWSPRGASEWEPRLGIFDGETPNEPDGSNGGWGCNADTCAQTLWWYPSNGRYARWWLALDFDE